MSGFKEPSSVTLQQVVINPDVAFSSFFNPKLKMHFTAFKRKSAGYKLSHYTIIFHREKDDNPRYLISVICNPRQKQRGSVKLCMKTSHYCGFMVHS